MYWFKKTINYFIAFIIQKYSILAFLTNKKKLLQKNIYK